MVGHLAHVQDELIFKLKAHWSCGLVPSKVGSLNGNVVDLGERVKHLERDLGLHKDMIVDSKKGKARVEKV